MQYLLTQEELDGLTSKTAKKYEVARIKYVKDMDEYVKRLFDSLAGASYGESRIELIQKFKMTNEPPSFTIT